ncbi:MAG: 2-oxoglutarate and iron-dependent oxygenase domain-containing protein [Pigmentiphaga sp.]|uniref:isopenicillin N synthase family dioxygenase n=1 Tax=Pigmentiphaga sp. TaxID=1977564 RepID=UPI0029BDDE2D|nr:2-oxoglutarate and iron-dependent oxygenase domain-containing protein [Pigmentiphaga sp.]MDX3906009.1 2-oxoglutarate and iron-dependent oxygenase domain-containing protein [Pigmentiphaga sp.]
MTTLKAHHIPVVDIAPFFQEGGAGKAAVAAAVQDACESLGFLVIAGHGVPEEKIQTLYDQALSFFDLPLEEKSRVRKPPGTAYKGYGAMGVKTVGKDINPKLKPSLHESFAIGPLDYTDDPYFTCEAAGNNFTPNMWPARPEGLRPAMTAYYREMERLARGILDIFAHILDVPPAYFASKVDKHNSILRTIHYPGLDRVPAPGEERSGAHTDTTAITILRVDDAPGGLQVLLPDGGWLDVPKIPGTFIVNIGDIMMRWTNDRFVSTMHRVVNPPDGLGAAARRLSIPFFFMPNYDALVECIPSCAGSGAKYPPIESGKLLSTRYAVTYSVN